MYESIQKSLGILTSFHAEISTADGPWPFDMIHKY